MSPGITLCISALVNSWLKAVSLAVQLLSQMQQQIVYITAVRFLDCQEADYLLYWHINFITL